MITVQEMLTFTAQLDLRILTHHIFWALKEGEVQPTDDMNCLHDVDYDEEAVEALIEENVLAIGKIQLYVVTTTTPEWYAFYFAENVLEASMLHQSLFGQRPKHVTNGEALMGKTFDFEDGRTSEVLFMYRSKVAAFPYFLGCAWAGEHVFYV